MRTSASIASVCDAPGRSSPTHNDFWDAENDRHVACSQRGRRATLYVCRRQRGVGSVPIMPRSIQFLRLPHETATVCLMISGSRRSFPTRRGMRSQHRGRSTKFFQRLATEVSAVFGLAAANNHIGGSPAQRGPAIRRGADRSARDYVQGCLPSCAYGREGMPGRIVRALPVRSIAPWLIYRPALFDVRRESDKTIA
jgi:hypothetical protein